MECNVSLNGSELTVNEIANFYGVNDRNIKQIEKYFNIQIKGNNENMVVVAEGNTLNNVCKLFGLMVNAIKKGEEIDEILLNQLIKSIEDEQKNIQENIIFVHTYQKKPIKPKTYSQAEYYKALEDNTIVFATGAAGTGKTYLAVAYAIEQLKQNKVQKIIITRPIVEAGENLGFLPGELKEKVDPYLIPIYDALNDILGKETTIKYLEKEIIEIAPLAYMRGRTLSDAFVILDEAQNTTPIQMKMFLTRLGNRSKMVITGDESQIDLKDPRNSGLLHAKKILKFIDGIDFIEFSSSDVVRNPLVGKIIEAYEND